MVSCEEASKKMVEILGLKHEPVAVSLLHKGQKVPEGYKEPESNIRHCQSIMRARKGESLVVPVTKHACTVGGSALGLMPIPEKVASGQFHFNLGMYASPEAAKAMIDERPTIKEQDIQGTLVSPLSKAKVKPDVVVVTGTPEQVYWLIPAASTFSIGGRVTVEMASFQACCVDSTIVPYLTGKMNFSLGCFGCRRTTDIAPEEMLVGIPAARLDDIVMALDKLNERAIPKARVKV